MPFRSILILAAFAGLAACATPSVSQMAFEPRPGGDLAGDKAQCTRTANEIDINSPKEYTDGRYGVAAAMAARIDHASIDGGTTNRMREAVYQDCMIRKGWTPK